MTCPHCGFLMSPLDADCARCRHRGYVPPFPPPTSPIPNAQHPTPNYSYSPMPHTPRPQPSLRGIEVLACLMSVCAVMGIMLFGTILRERRNARQQAQIAALQQQLAEVQQAQANAQVRVITSQPQIINIEVSSPVSTVVVPRPMAYSVYDPFADHLRIHHEVMTQHLDLMRQHTASMQRMQMQSAPPSTLRTSDPRDPFNPVGRF